MPRRLCTPSLPVLTALALSCPALSQAIRVGAELQVNTHTEANQNYPSVAAAAGGGFVVVWASYGQDGSYSGIFAQRFSSSGDALAAEFQVNTYTASSQYGPALATDAEGGFVVAWTSYGQDGSTTGVFAQRFSSSGDALGVELQVNTYTDDEQFAPAAAADADGDFVVVWVSFGQDGSFGGIFGQRFSSSGGALAAEFQVNTYTSNRQYRPAVTADADGDFVVAWASFQQDGQFDGVFARRFSNSGSALAVELQVNTYTTDDQEIPSVAMDADGDFVVAWQSVGQDGSGAGVFARRFSSSGSALAVELQVNTHTSNDQRRAAVTVDTDGDFVVAWESLSQDGSLGGIFGQRFASTGVAVAAELQVNTFTETSQGNPRVAMDADGDFVVAWQSVGQDGSDDGVFAQRFAVPAILDIDGNGATGALTDGLLVLRYLFGFTGDTLVAAAVDLGGCTRCDAAAILTYLGSLAAPSDGLVPVIDVDANGALGPLTDGLLILRYLFGFTGATLVGGAVDTSACTRCGAEQIESHLASLL